MTTPVTTSEFFTLTGVFSCPIAWLDANTMNAASKTAHRETVRFIRASHKSEDSYTCFYFPAWGTALSVIYGQRRVMCDPAWSTGKSPLGATQRLRIAATSPSVVTNVTSATLAGC